MSTPMNLTPAAIREQLSRNRDAAFGPRENEALEAILDTASNALSLLASESLSAYEREPDFITGSSVKERTV